MDYDYHKVFKDTTIGTSRIYVYYSELSQAGWGNPVSFNKDNITGFQIVAEAGNGTGNFNYSLIIDF